MVQTFRTEREILCTQTVRAPVPWRSLRNMLDFLSSILRSTYTSPKPSFKHRRVGVRASCPTCVFEFILITLRSTYTPFTTHCLMLEFHDVAVKSQVRLLVSIPFEFDRQEHTPFFFRVPSPNQRSVSNVLTFDVHVNCHGMFCSLLSVFHHYIWVWGDKLSTPHVLRLHQR